RAYRVLLVGDGGTARKDAGVPEVQRDLRAQLQIGLREEPHHHEERHHRRDEVGVGELPHAHAAMGREFTAIADDDAAARLVGVHVVAAFTCLQARSVSSPDGRSAEKIALRANSMATTGAAPRSAATMPSLMLRR